MSTATISDVYRITVGISHPTIARAATPRPVRATHASGPYAIESQEAGETYQLQKLGDAQVVVALVRIPYT